MEQLRSLLGNYWNLLAVPRIAWTDILEIIILSFLLYELLVWFRRTRAWTLFKGILVLFLFTLFAAILNLNTILWLVSNTISVGIIAVIILFQPELRRALEQLGRNGLFSSLSFFDDNRKNEEDRYSDRTITEVIKATYEMAKERTGALIVLENKVALGEFEHTGIAIDAEVSSQLLINIFEHNTPLHDGAVILRPNRIVSATCYLPLSNNTEISKELGTRHRAGLGVSEVSDCITIIVSEETGKVSLAMDGTLYRDIEAVTIRNKVLDRQKKTIHVRSLKWWKDREKHEKNQ
ncbi:MAG: diadenylate cyclase CdaA [Lachnospiraceae bacterium]